MNLTIRNAICWMPQWHAQNFQNQTWVVLCTEILKLILRSWTCLLKTNCSKNVKHTKFQRAWLVLGSHTKGNLDPKSPSWLQNRSFKSWVLKCVICNSLFMAFRSTLEKKTLSRLFSAESSYILGMLIGKHRWVVKQSKNPNFGAHSHGHSAHSHGHPLLTDVRKAVGEEFLQRFDEMLWRKNEETQKVKARPTGGV